jgi:IS605 OrfB family transposase
VNGRLRIPFLAGEHQLAMLKMTQGEADLVYRKGAFYLYQTCEVEAPDPDDPDGWLGVDLGIVNIATDSDGEIYSGSQVNGLRHRHARLRAKLQSKDTKSAKRRLKQRRYKESRFAKDVNHCIAKGLVGRAKDTGRGIALENLKGIRERITVRKAQRRQQYSWSFYDLRQKIEYKAAIAGVPVVLVNPRNTSRTCPICGCIDKRNRPTQSLFSCVSCGHSAPADHIAATNISRRAAVNPPNAATLPS